MRPLRGLFRKPETVDVKQGEVTAIDPVAADRDHRRGPAVLRRPPRAGHGHRAELLRGHRRRRARVPALLRRRRRAPPQPHPAPVRGRRPRPGADRAGGAELRHRRRRRHRRRDGRCPRRPDPRRDAAALPRPRTSSAPTSTSSTTATSCSRRSPTRPTSTPPRSLTKKGVELLLGQSVTEVAADRVVFARRHRDPDPLRRLGRRA